MKNILKNGLLSLVALVFFTACEKEELRAVLNSSAVPVITLNSASLELTKENADQTALTVSWAKPDFGFSAGAQYRILVDQAGSNFANAQTFSTGSELSRSWTHQQLNSLLQAMGADVTQPFNLDIAVESILSDKSMQRSAINQVSALGYLDKLDLSSSWGVVGSGAENGWDGPDMPFYKTADAGIFVAFVTLKDGEIKIRENNDWAVNYGDDGADGSLDAGGANIVVSAGTYAITFDSNNLTYTIKALSWGIVGSAAPNGWDGPDHNFFYDPTSDQWRALVTLAEGEMKVRMNNDWAVNYGDTGADGSLEAGGDNIAVSAGTYLITFNQNELTLEIESIDIPGIVGSGAPNGWDGPDVSLIPDFGRDDFWIANNVPIVDGEIKFRMNNDWAVNYGDDGADGSLELNGANIVVEAGNYDVELDFSDAASPKYSLTKK